MNIHILERLQHNDLILSYKKFGSGKNVFLAFHGHGKSHEDFQLFAKPLNATIYAFDLFGHGESPIEQERIPNRPLKIEEFKFILEKLIEREQISQFSILGYSLGGKMAIHSFMLFPKLVERIILLAPDGIKEIGWYTKTSKSKILNWVYQKTIKRPGFFMGIVKTARFLRLIPLNLFRFLEYQFATEERRRLSYQTWSFYREVFPNKEIFAKKCQEFQPDLFVISGVYDRVIRTEYIQRFKDEFYSNLNLTELKIGHDFFKPKSLELVLTVIE